MSLIPELARDYEEKETRQGTRLDVHIPDDFKLFFTFGASTRIDWELLPQRHILVSAYHVIHRSGRQQMVVDMIEKRNRMDSLMIDSSAIIAMGKSDTDWFDRQPEIVAFANAVDADFVVSLDILCKAHLLEKCKMTLKEAQAKTVENAAQMLDLKTKARKVFTLQGFDKTEYLDTLDEFNDLGILDNNNNVIGIGSQAGERRELTIDRCSFIARHTHDINPHLDMHAFGIGTPYTVVQLYKAGITSVDNATPMVLTRLNKWMTDTGEPSDARFTDQRISAQYQAQMLWNYSTYWVALNKEFHQQQNL